MKILVTGANGFMGHGIIKSLSQMLDGTIIASDLEDYKYKDDNIVSVKGNIFSLENPYEYYGKPDIVLHLAWRDGFKHASETHINDLPLHYKFLKNMVDSGVKKIVVLGTMHEIGFHEGSINEKTPCNPLSLYGIAKNALRELCIQLTNLSETKLQWVRGYYIVDNSTNGASIFSKLMQAAEQGKTSFPFTSGINQYDFLDFEIFCEQVARIVINNTEFGIINACSGRPMTLKERVEKFIKDNNLNIKLEYGVYPDRPYDSLAVWGDNTRIRKIMESK